jgi:hypothetical protein
MKKIYTFITLLLLSGVIFAQHQKFVKTNATFRIGNSLNIERAINKFSSVHVIKEINNLSSNQTKAVVDSLYYDGANYDGVGTGGAITFGVYSYFSAATLTPHRTANHKFLSVKVYINGATNVSATQLRIYSNTGTTLLYSQNFTPIEGWNNVVLTTPFTIPASTNIYIGYYLTATGGYPAGCDAGPANANGNWIDDGGTWQHATDIDPSLIGNWNIRVMCGTLPVVPVATCNPLSWIAGNVPITTSVTSGTFTLSNTGSGTLTCSGISGLSTPFTTTLVPASVSLASGASTPFTFSYNPTIAGATNQAVVIATNGGNITINLSGTGTSCGTPINTFPWIESFEGTTFPTACWTKASPDAGTGWASIASGTTPLPGWGGGTMTVPTGGGTNAAYCTYTTGGTTYNDQWLISPQITVPANGVLSFNLFWSGHYQDYVDIKISTTTNATTSFTTTLLALDTLQYIQNTWKTFYINLSSLVGQNIYVAFNEHVTDNINDGAFIGLDLVKIDAAAANPVALCNPLSWAAGNVPTSTTVTSGTFTLSNTGSGTLTCSGISGLSAPFTTTLVPASVSLASGASTTFTFSYNPTIAGANNQTAVIATNGGNITISLSGTGTSCGTPISSFPWIESFEGAFPPSCWTKVSPDGGTGWAQIASGTAPIPGFGGGTMTVPAGGGTYTAYSSYQTGGTTYDDQWLITPQINVPANGQLSFSLLWFGAYQDLVDVKISTTTNAISSFTTTLLSLDTLQFIQDTWKPFLVNLSSFAGQNVYIAFNEHVADNAVDGAFIGIDLVKVDFAATNPVALCNPLSWSAGTVPVLTTVTSGTFTLSNTGAGTLTCSGISGLSAPFTTTLIPASVSLASGASTTFTFSYNPTVAGANNQTVIVATNGGNITINLSGAGLSCGVPISSFPWVESFEGVFPPSCWTKASPDAGTGWAQVASGTTPLPGWTGGTMTVPAGGGSNAAYCTWNTGGTTYNNQWLISPQINVPANALLTFSLFWSGAFQDYVDLKISTTSSNVANFTSTLVSLDTNSFILDAWKQFVIPISAYFGQNIYFAFNEHVADNTNDGAFIAIDLVRVDISTNVNQNVEVTEGLLSIYPNPATNMVMVNSSEKISHLKVLDLLGNIVYEEDAMKNMAQLNTSAYSKGIYFVVVNTEKQNFTRKLQIIK